MRLAPLLALTACLGGGGRVLRAPAHAGDPGAKLVDWIWYTPDPARWQASPWFRPGQDITTPARIVVSVDDYACLLDIEVDEPQAREYFICPTRWRYPQRRSFR